MLPQLILCRRVSDLGSSKVMAMRPTARLLKAEADASDSTV